MDSIWIGTKFKDDDYGPMIAKPYQEVCDPEYYGGTLVKTKHPIPGMSEDFCVTSGVGMWSEKVYHFKPDKPPSSAGDEI